MAQVEHVNSINQIALKKDEINRIARQLGKEELVFRHPVVALPSFSCIEAGFLKSVSWLYTLYFESGRVNIEFLLDQMCNYRIQEESLCRSHIKLIHSLRTILQHSTDIAEEHDAQLHQIAETWIFERCGTVSPQTDEHWNYLLEALLQEANAFIHALADCIVHIQEDPFVSQIVSEWNYRCTRYHPPHEFDRLISIVAADFGQSQINAVSVRKRYYENWKKELDLLSGNYNFEIEARRLIERELSKTPVLPITGNDIMQVFGISPGPQVKMLYNRARTLYEANPCTKEQLLERLRQSLLTEAPSSIN